MHRHQVSCQGSHGSSGLPLTTLSASEPLLLDSGARVKEAQPSFLPRPRGSVLVSPLFPVSRNISPALLISQIARGEHMTSTLEAHWCLDQLLPAWILASVIFVLSVFIEASLSVCLSQLHFSGTSSILRLSLQPGADPHPQLMSIMQIMGPLQQRWRLSAYPWAPTGLPSH